MGPDPASIRSPRLQRLLRYWQEKRGDRTMPPRAEIDPVDIPELLSNILMIEVRPEVGYLVRIAGTAIVERYGEDYTGRYLQQTEFGARTDAIMDAYDACRLTCAPHYSEGNFTGIHNVYTLIERLIVPLSDDGRTVDRMLAGIEFYDAGAD